MNVFCCHGHGYAKDSKALDQWEVTTYMAQSQQKSQILPRESESLWMIDQCVQRLANYSFLLLGIYILRLFTYRNLLLRLTIPFSCIVSNKHSVFWVAEVEDPTRPQLYGLSVCPFFNSLLSRFQDTKHIGWDYLGKWKVRKRRISLGK